MGQLQKFTKLLLKQSQSNFGYVSIPKDPNIVLNYEKAKYCDVTFRDKSGLDEQISRSGPVQPMMTDNFYEIDEIDEIQLLNFHLLFTRFRLLWHLAAKN